MSLMRQTIEECCKRDGLKNVDMVEKDVRSVMEMRPSRPLAGTVSKKVVHIVNDVLKALKR